MDARDQRDQRGHDESCGRLAVRLARVAPHFGERVGTIPVRTGRTARQPKLYHGGDCNDQCRHQHTVIKDGVEIFAEGADNADQDDKSQREHQDPPAAPVAIVQPLGRDRQRGVKDKQEDQSDDQGHGGARNPVQSGGEPIHDQEKDSADPPIGAADPTAGAEQKMRPIDLRCSGNRQCVNSKDWRASPQCSQQAYLVRVRGGSSRFRPNLKLGWKAAGPDFPVAEEVAAVYAGDCCKVLGLKRSRTIAPIIYGNRINEALALGTVLLSASMHDGAAADSEREPGRAGLVVG